MEICGRSLLAVGSPRGEWLAGKFKHKNSADKINASGGNKASSEVLLVSEVRLHLGFHYEDGGEI